jgi:VCBS repeat-containing protein
MRLIAADADGDGMADDTLLQGDRDGPTNAANGWVTILHMRDVLPEEFVSTNFSANYALTTGNPPPLAEPDAYQVDEDSVLNAFVPGVLANDIDPNGDAFTAQLVSGASHGTVVLAADGGFTYTPFANFSGIDSFTYRGNDGVSLGNIATVTITVNAENDAPNAFNNSYNVQQGQVLTVAVGQGVLANDNDPDGDAMTAALVAGPANGTLTLSADGSFVYTPTAGYFGPDQFTYRANDGALDSTVATVSITVVGANTPPAGVADAYTATEDTPLVIADPALGVLANDTDGQGDVLTAALGSVSGGTVALNPDGTFTFTPAPNFQGTGGFTYRPNDGQALGNVTSVTITVANVNDAPVAVNNSYTTAEDTALEVAGPGVLGNDSDVDPGEALTAVLVAGPANGTLSLDATGGFTYTPNADFSGADSFTYRANDGEADSNIATVAITVTPQNDAPVAAGDGYTVDEDGILTVGAAAGVLANDTDADGNPLTAVLVSGPGNGSFSLAADGSFEFIPAANFNGQASFTYRASDGITQSAPVTVLLTVTPTNDAPTAAGNGYTLDEDGTLVIAAPGVLGNDSDVDGDALSALVETAPANGMLTLNADGSLTYTPNADFFGGDSFTYRASDGALTSAAVTVSLSVNAVNDAPVAGADAVNAAFETPLVIPVASLLANDADVDNPTLSVTGVGGAVNGTVSLAAGVITFTPDAGFSGAASFTYTVSDGALGDTGAVAVTVAAAANSAPVAVNDAFSGDEDTVLTGNVLANDTDADVGAVLTAALVAGPTSGTLALNPDGSFTYTAGANAHGAASFTYRVNDGSVDGNVATVSLTVTPVNDAPTASDAAFVTDEDVAFNGNLLALLGAADIDGDDLDIVSVGTTGLGSFALDTETGGFTFTPAADANGAGAVAVALTDGTVTVNRVLSFTVTPINDDPVAVDDTQGTTRDTPLVVQAAALLANDSDIDGGALVITGVSNAANGTVSLGGTTITFTPTAGFEGIGSFAYTVSDGAGGTDTAIVTVGITAGTPPVNTPPVGVADAFSGNEDTVLSGNVLANDTDADAATTLSAILVSGPANAAAFTLNADGSFTYTPDANFNGADSFTYRPNDGVDDGGVTTVTLTVAAVEDSPISAPDTATTAFETAVTIDVLANDVEVDGQPLSIILWSAPFSGTATVNPDNTITFTPGVGFSGDITFSYRAFDGVGFGDTTQVSVTVGASPNRPPVADDVAFTIAEDAPFSANLFGFTNDPEFNQASIQVLGTTNLTVTSFSEATGAIVVQPVADFSGTATITYQVTDSGGLTDSGVVTLTVTPVNDAPVAANDTASTAFETPLTLPFATLLANDSDVDGDTLLVITVGGAVGGSVAPGAGGIVFTPDAGFSGAASFAYTITDGTTTDSATVTVTVAGPGNTAPVAVDDAFATRAAQPVLITLPALIANDTDADGDALAFDFLVSGVTNGTLVGDAFGNLTYTPNAGFVGEDTFTYQVADGAGGTDIGTVTITVTNAAPDAGDDIVSTRAGRVLDIAAADLLANDSDADGDTLAIDLLVDTVDNGLLLITAEGFTYTPNAGFVGQDTFIYRVADGFGGFDEATVTINVVNAAPVAVDDAITYHGRSATFLAASLLANDTDADGDTLSFETIIGPLNGTLVSDGDSLVYTPPAGFFGSETFTYTVKDGFGGTDTATVTMTLVNAAPDAKDDAFSTAFGTALLIPTAQVLGNDTDADGDPLLVSVTGTPANGQVMFGPLGFFYQPKAGFVGLDSFAYTVDDGFGGTDTATVSVVVGAAPLPTTAFTISQGGTGNPPGSVPSGPALTPAQLALIDATPVVIGAEAFTRLENEDGWNGFKNAAFGPGEYTPAFGGNILFANFVDNRIDLSDAVGVDLDVVVVGGKRGLLRTADGDDEATWFFHSNEGFWSNLATIDTGLGDDVITISSINLTTLDNDLLADNPNPGNGALWNAGYDGRFSVARVQAGEGDDVVTAAGRSRLEAFGGTGNDIITGAIGNDLLVGGDGNDTLTGGAGADRFRFDNADGTDVIIDFSAAQGDRVQLSSGGSTTLAGTSFTYGTTTVTADNGHVWTAADFLFV